MSKLASIAARFLNAKTVIVITVSVILNIFFISVRLGPILNPLYREVELLVIREINTGLFPSSEDYQQTWKFENGDKDTHLKIPILAVAVMSSPSNLERRTVIRKTWKNGYQKRTHYVKFVLGTKSLDSELVERLEKENSEHKDLILLTDVMDSYSNLPHKVLSTLVWFDQNVQYSYLLKCDDDTFPLLDKMEDELRQRDHSHGLYWGYFFPNSPPQREGKWAEPNWKFCDRFFPYANGGGYVLSADVIHRIASNADALIVYNNEDVSVGSWTVSYDIERKHDARFACQFIPRGCQNSFLIFHFGGERTIDETIQKDKLIRETGNVCEQEYLNDEYQYDWSKLPRNAYRHTCRWLWYKNILWMIMGTVILTLACFCFIRKCVAKDSA